MPTIPELREMAKAHGISVPSRANKGQIEELLRKQGVDLPAEVKGNRSAKAAAVASPAVGPPVRTNAVAGLQAASAASPARDERILPTDLALLVVSYPSRSSDDPTGLITYVIEYRHINNPAKLAAQANLPVEEREKDENGVDYVAQLCQMARDTLPSKRFVAKESDRVRMCMVCYGA